MSPWTHRALRPVPDVPGDGHGVPRSSPLVPRRSVRLLRLAALGAPAALGAVLVPVRTSFPGVDAALVMVVVIVAVASAGDRVAGVLGAISAGVWFDFFLTRPYERFAISHRPDIETTVLLLVVGLAVTELTARGRHHRQVAAEESGYVAELHSVARMMADGADARMVIARVEKVLTSLLGLRSCHYDASPTPAHRATIGQGGDVVLAGLRWSWLPGPHIDLPVRYQGRTYGTFVLSPTPGAPVPEQRRLVAVALADEVGAVLAGAERKAQ